MATAAQNPQLPLFYQTLEPVNVAQHGNMKVRTMLKMGQIGQTHAIPSVQDERDHMALIKTLTQDVVPLYYLRDATGLPREWIARQKNAFRTLAWRFNADRMVMDYVSKSYVPAAGGLSCSMDVV